MNSNMKVIKVTLQELRSCQLPDIVSLTLKERREDLDVRSLVAIGDSDADPAVHFEWLEVEEDRVGRLQVVGVLDL